MKNSKLGSIVRLAAVGLFTNMVGGALNPNTFSDKVKGVAINKLYSEVRSVKLLFIRPTQAQIDLIKDRIEEQGVTVISHYPTYSRYFGYRFIVGYPHEVDPPSLSSIYQATETPTVKVIEHPATTALKTI